MAKFALVLASVSTLFAQPNLIVSSSSLVFEAQMGNPGPPAKTLDIGSNGAPITFIVLATSQGGNWLSVTAAYEARPAGFDAWQAVTPESVAVLVNTTQLTRPGTYTGTVTIAADGAANSPISVPVTLHLRAPSLLIANPTALQFQATIGTASLPSQVVDISLVPPGLALPEPTFSVVTGNSWLSLAPVACASSVVCLAVSANPTGLIPGVYSGSIAVSVAGALNNPITVPVTLVFTAVPLSLVVSPPALSFSATAGAPPPAQNFNVSSASPSSSLPGATAAVTQGSAWLSVTPVGTGQFAASVNPAGLAAGSYSGAIAVLVQGATNGPTTIPVTLDVSGVAVTGVLNAASYAKDASGAGLPVAPGSLVQIYAMLPGADPGGAAMVPLPGSLGGVSVTFNNIPAPLNSVVPTGAFPSINAQVPFEVLGSGQASATANVVVTVNGVASAPWVVSIVPAAPGVFTISPAGEGNATFAFIDPADHTAKIAAPPGASIGYPTAPVPRGQAGLFYATGLGDMMPPVADGDDGSKPAVTHNANATPIVLVGGISAAVQYAGQAPGHPGVNQINITIPQNAPTGNAVPLQIQTADGTFTSSNLVTIAIQ